MKKKEFNKLFGKLEAEIMESVWQLKSASVRDVLNTIKRKPKPAYTTIMTVMVRLCDKGILKRKVSEHDAYIYTPVQDKQDFFASASKKIISGLINDFGEDIAIAQFMDVLENGNIKKSKEWQQKLKEIIK